MSADSLEVRGRFRDTKGSYNDIQQVLIDGLSQHLTPNDYPVVWEDYFQFKNDYLEIWLDDSFGNWGRAIKFIKEDFVKAYQDVVFEFYCIERNGWELTGEKVICDGENLECVLDGFYLNLDEFGYDEDDEDELNEKLDEYDEELIEQIHKKEDEFDKRMAFKILV